MKKITITNQILINAGNIFYCEDSDFIARLEQSMCAIIEDYETESRATEPIMEQKPKVGRPKKVE